MFKTELIGKLKERKATLGIVGMGYVGLPLALRFAEVGFSVIGFDTNDERVASLNRSESYIRHISNDKLIVARERGFKATSNYEEASKVDALILCLPTPLNKYREPDLSCVLGSVEALLPYLHQGQIVSLESTTYPGTTEEELQPRIEKCGFKLGEDFFLVFSPEREDPANQDFHTAIIPKVCGGITPHCLAVGEALYEQVVSRVVKVSSTRTAEITKLLENIHRAVNIGLMNELKHLAYEMDIDIFEVIHAAATKPFGFVPYYPGPGIGGHCIPVDPFYLTWKAREFGIHTRFIELAGQINSSMPAWVIRRLVSALNKYGKPIQNSKILLLGLAYKVDIDDIRQSPSINLIDLLFKAGAKVDYSDPFVPKFNDYHGKVYDMTSLDLSVETIKQYDAVILATCHTEFDYDMIRENAQLIVDTRGKYHDITADTIIKA
ncbi:nucleotide sugar dehydrogenase [Rickettsiella endosymbiont of Dermanyssus gallinae]|uniref:nucleotide sugar dehydrogenase n=1 Tax=Rickettsiella endosymbiont of Dermanyssus gallinae TaxID=2856608 RepID=UPI001C52F18F|nr:nucleotide sugar dehydrogenase [Rickettsiella endosymbiont of Dermanyssus gallinae]